MMGHFVIVKTWRDWVDQAKAGVEVQTKYKGHSLRQAFVEAKADSEEDWKALCLMVEAFIALGVSVDYEVQRLAGIRDIDGVI